MRCIALHTAKNNSILLPCTSLRVNEHGAVITPLMDSQMQRFYQTTTVLLRDSIFISFSLPHRHRHRQDTHARTHTPCHTIKRNRWVLWGGDKILTCCNSLDLYAHPTRSQRHTEPRTRLLCELKFDNGHPYMRTSIFLPSVTLFFRPSNFQFSFSKIKARFIYHYMPVVFLAWFCFTCVIDMICSLWPGISFLYYLILFLFL